MLTSGKALEFMRDITIGPSRSLLYEVRKELIEKHFKEAKLVDDDFNCCGQRINKWRE
jgi:hypothetical protein